MIPITYLLCLAIILTPILIVLILQILNFQSKESSLSQLILKKEACLISTEEKYKMANICIDHKKLSLALIILEDELYTNSKMTLTWQAKYYNAIGFIFNSLNLNIIAKEYYNYACTLNPEYLYSRKNLNNLSR